MGKRDKLTGMQDAFVNLLAADPHRNGTKAAIAAGAAPKSAHTVANKWLKMEKVQNALNARLLTAQKKTGVTIERVIAELERLAFVDLADIYEEDGQLKPIKEIPEDARRAIASVETENPAYKPGVTVTKVRLWDKRGALNDLRDYLQPVKKVELTGKDGAPLVPPAEPIVALNLLSKADLDRLIEATKE